MRTIAIPAVTVLALVLAGCGDTPTVNKPAIEKSIREVEADMSKAFAAKDATAFAAHYTADAILMAPGMAPMKGHDAIVAGIKAMLSDPNLKLDFSSDRTEVASSGDMAALRGTYNMVETDPATKQPMTDKGSYVTVFQKQKDGAWKAVFDINTSEVPLPAAPAHKTASKPKPPVKKKARKR